MKKLLSILFLLIPNQKLFCWGFYMHEQINYHAVFLLPPEMLVLFKPNIEFLRSHAVDPDKRRYMVALTIYSRALAGLWPALTALLNVVKNRRASLN